MDKSYEEERAARRVLSVFERHGWGDLLIEGRWKKLLPGGESQAAGFERSESERAGSLKSALEELGGVFPTVGRVLSYRPDVLPQPYVEELARIQEREVVVPIGRVRELLDSEWDEPCGEVLERLDEEPFSVTGSAQIHRGKLASSAPGLDFLDVEVKVVKPGVEPRTDTDLRSLRKAADLVVRAAPELGDHLPFLVREIEEAVRAELDLRIEARSAGRLRRTLAEYGRLRVPRVVDPLSTHRILVCERIPTESLSTLIERGGHPDLADELWRGFLKQILDEGAFLDRLEPETLLTDSRGSLVFPGPFHLALLSRETQLRLVALLLALVERDGNRVAGACVEMGRVGPAFRESVFRSEVGEMMVRRAGDSLGDIALELATLSRWNHIRFPPALISLGRVLRSLEPLCRRLDPRMEPMATVREMASSVLGGEISRELGSERMLVTALELRSVLSEVPFNLRRILSRLSSNDLRLGVRLEESEALERSLRNMADRVTLGLVAAALIVGSALLLQIDAGPRLWGYPVVPLAALVLASGLGVYVVVKTIGGE